MQNSHVLILGGTGEARALAQSLEADQRFDIVSSLAGRTHNPNLPPGEVRIGGFGGAQGLAGYIEAEGIDLVVDATHPFAAEISRNAFAACLQTSTPLVRLERPAWQPGDGDQWRMAADIDAAALALADGDHAFITVGRQELAPFFARTDVTITARMIEAPELTVPATARIIIARPPFDLEAERTLMVEHEITVLVCKNSGGEATAAKLNAARALNLPVIMVERPELPEVQAAATPEDLGALITRILSV